MQTSVSNKTTSSWSNVDVIASTIAENVYDLRYSSTNRNNASKKGLKIANIQRTKVMK